MWCKCSPFCPFAATQRFSGSQRLAKRFKNPLQLDKQACDPPLNEPFAPLQCCHSTSQPKAQARNISFGNYTETKSKSVARTSSCNLRVFLLPTFTSKHDTCPLLFVRTSSCKLLLPSILPCDPKTSLCKGRRAAALHCPCHGTDSPAAGAPACPSILRHAWHCWQCTVYGTTHEGDPSTIVFTVMVLIMMLQHMIITPQATSYSISPVNIIALSAPWVWMSSLLVLCAPCPMPPTCVSNSQAAAYGSALPGGSQWNHGTLRTAAPPWQRLGPAHVPYWRVRDPPPLF